MRRLHCFNVFCHSKRAEIFSDKMRKKSIGGFNEKNGKRQARARKKPAYADKTGRRLCDQSLYGMSAQMPLLLRGLHELER